MINDIERSTPNLQSQLLEVDNSQAFSAYQKIQLQNDIDSKTLVDAPPIEDVPQFNHTIEELLLQQQYFRRRSFYEDAANGGYIDYTDVNQFVGTPPLDIPRISGRFKNKGNKSPNLTDYKVTNNGLTNKTAGYLALYPSGLKFRRKKLTTEFSIPDDVRKRGVISGFSEDSRRRLRSLMMRINWDDYINQTKKAEKSKSFFISLTYGQSYHEDWSNYKRDLQVFRKRLSRWFEKRSIDFGSIWKLEFQSRGAAHYHLMLFCSRRVSSSSLLRFISRSWVQIASDSFGYSSDYINTMERVHLGVLRSTGKCVIPVYSHINGGASRLMSYLMKYMCKEYEVHSIDSGAPVETGRVWGVWNKENIPFDKPVVFRFYSRDGYKQFVDSVNAYGREIKSDYLNNLNGNFPVTVFGSGLDLLSRFLSQIPDPLSVIGQV